METFENIGKYFQYLVKREAYLAGGILGNEERCTLNFYPGNGCFLITPKIRLFS